MKSSRHAEKQFPSILWSLQQTELWVWRCGHTFTHSDAPSAEQRLTETVLLFKQLGVSTHTHAHTQDEQQHQCCLMMPPHLRKRSHHLRKSFFSWAFPLETLAWIKWQISLSLNLAPTTGFVFVVVFSHVTLLPPARVLRNPPYVLRWSLNLHFKSYGKRDISKKIITV